MVTCSTWTSTAAPSDESPSPAPTNLLWRLQNTFAKGPQAAGVIHTDFEKGYIRAETIAYDDYVSCNGEAGARDAGKFRLEGKDYVVKDGDVMHFRFNT